MKVALALWLALMPLPGLAHIHIHPETAGAGETVDLVLIVGHGCAGAPTTALRVAIPEGLTAEPLAQPGWHVTSAKGEIGWQGGPLPDHEKAQFVLRATISADAPGTIPLPVVQVCGDQQLRWIEPDAAADHPAPALQVLPKK